MQHEPHFDYLLLTPDIIVSICHITKLERLLLQESDVSAEAQRALKADFQGIYLCNVWSLEILTSSQGDTSWYAMLFCPKLVSLVVRPAGLFRLVFPPQESTWLRCRFFPTLRYLLLAHLSLVHFTRFLHWMQQGSRGHTPHEVEVERGISDFQILETFRSAPLEVLSIEGALKADLPLFDWIAQHFSHLLGLTVMRRSSNRQSYNICSLASPKLAICSLLIGILEA